MMQAGRRSVFGYRVLVVAFATMLLSCGGGGSDPQQVAAPQFSPPPGTYTTARSVTLTTATPGASIRYTTDNTTPTDTAGTLYTGPFAVSSTATVKAVAYLAGWTPSPVATGAYTITGTVAAPVFSPDPGRYSLSRSVTISTMTPNAQIRYTIDNTTPTDNTGTVYTGPVIVSSTTTIKAVAYLAGWDPSPVSVAPYTIAGPYACTANASDNNVSVVDLSARALVGTVPVGNGPVAVAVNRAGTRAYSANSGSNDVSVVDIPGLSVVATIPVGSGPHGLALTPDGTRLYVANWNSNNVSVIDTSSNTVVATVAVGNTPFTVAVTPDGTKAYVTNYNDVQVYVIGTGSNTVVAQIPVGGTYNTGIVVSPDGSKAYASSWANGIHVIDTATDNMIATVANNGSLWGSGPAAVSSDGSKLYVPAVYSTCFGYSCTVGNQVAIVDTASRTVTKTVTVGNGPTDAVIDSLGGQVFVTAMNSNNVTAIDTATDTVSGTAVTVGAAPYGIAIEAWR